MSNFNQTQAAYIAGILDGEGYITISKRKCKETRKDFYYNARLTVVNTDGEDMV